MGHYAKYNLSFEGNKGSNIAIEGISSIAESFVYVYLGLSSFMIKEENINYNLIISVLVATVIARVISVFTPIILIYFFNGRKMNLKWNEVAMISIGGIIRGAIAFGLALDINTPNRDVLKTTVQICVLFTTLLLGNTMGLIAKILNIKKISKSDLREQLLTYEEVDGKLQEKQEKDAFKIFTKWKEFDLKVVKPFFRKKEEAFRETEDEEEEKENGSEKHL